MLEFEIALMWSHYLKPAPLFPLEQCTSPHTNSGSCSHTLIPVPVASLIATTTTGLLRFFVLN